MTEERTHTATSAAQAPPPVRCAVYIRVNVGAVQNTESIRLQRKTAEAFLDSHDADSWTCVGTYEDIGHSAGKLERPGFQRLLADINDGKVDCIIVHSLDRLVRMHEHGLMLMALLRRCNAKVIAVCGEPYVVDGDVWI
jgi:DNA invertase Pin-like site-specific DNA recombinase